MRVFDKAEIVAALEPLELQEVLERAFIAYSLGAAVLAPVSELLFDNPPGDVHIKAGYVAGDEHFVVKIASGFYQNPDLGLPSSNGLMLLFSQRTGQAVALLHDEGHLTDVRTAVAGQIAAAHLAPTLVTRIGILGTGTQAWLQLRYLQTVTPCREVLVWGRREEALQRYRNDMAALGFKVATTGQASEVAATCNLIVTTTPSTEALLRSEDVRAGTHITAVGSDTPEKCELEPALLARADRVVVDSLRQSRERGEVSQALRRGVIFEDKLVELGNLLRDKGLGRSSDDELTIADLTGLAVQDLAIAEAVYVHLSP
ncbi:MAG TPA: ornithine cyclodeaminase family protein [Chloroflexota bacterium]|nr:ornithine cyclodeaminase family protein [Chloroflexota bacterium]